MRAQKTPDLRRAQRSNAAPERETCCPVRRVETCSRTLFLWHAFTSSLSKQENLFGIRNSYVLLNSTLPQSKSAYLGRLLQFTNLLNLTLLTRPSIRNTDQVFEPPELINGSGIPVIGIRPITIPTFTNT